MPSHSRLLWVAYFFLAFLLLDVTSFQGAHVSKSSLARAPVSITTLYGGENIDDSRSTLEASFASSPPSESFTPDGLGAVARLRRRTEVSLLMDLCSEDGNDDDAISNLWQFWHNERGSKGRDALTEVDFYMRQPGTWPNAEDILRDLIFDNPTWIEPKNKLATLLYLKGQNYVSSQILAAYSTTTLTNRYFPGLLPPLRANPCLQALALWLPQRCRSSVRKAQPSRALSLHACQNDA